LIPGSQCPEFPTLVSLSLDNLVLFHSNTMVLNTTNVLMLIHLFHGVPQKLTQVEMLSLTSGVIVQSHRHLVVLKRPSQCQHAQHHQDQKLANHVSSPSDTMALSTHSAPMLTYQLLGVPLR